MLACGDNLLTADAITLPAGRGTLAVAQIKPADRC